MQCSSFTNNFNKLIDNANAKNLESGFHRTFHVKYYRHHVMEVQKNGLLPII